MHLKHIKHTKNRNSAYDSLGDHLFFLWHSLCHPKVTGAQLPSSQDLAKAMVHAVDSGKTGGIVELGPGTGSFTKALRAAGFAEDRICPVELSPKFARNLQEKYPRMKIIEASAFDVEKWQDQIPFREIQGVVSGLPLMLFSPEQNLQFLDNLLSLKKLNAGKVIQFSYFGRDPLRVRGRTDTDNVKHLKIEKIDFVWKNLYPATVWCYSLA